MPPPGPSQSAGSISADHESFLSRLDEVTTIEYPFPLPARPKLSGPRVDLKSWANVRPLLRGAAGLLAVLLCPVATLFLAAVAFLSSGVASGVAAALSAACAASSLRDCFFLHYVTDGGAGGLGCGDGEHAGAGFFCGRSARVRAVRERLMTRLSPYRPTPYLYSGDLLTLAPFLFFKGSVGGRVAYRRRWVRVPSAPAPDGKDGPSRRPSGADSDEAVALDVAFPPGGHDAGRPTFLVLHGLNGGSTEPYVLDLARRANAEGITLAVMVARGMMKTPLKGMDSFHGARTSDVGCAVDALSYALSGRKRATNPQIVLVGFSMGGIVAANYATKARTDSGLAGALSFSGSLCSEKLLLPTRAVAHSLTTWQPALAWGLKATVVKPNQHNLAQRGVSPAFVEEIETVTDIDSRLVTKYHGYPDVRDYYEDLSAAGRGDAAGREKLNGAAVPLLEVHAVDDPIAPYESCFASAVGDTENVALLATQHGGHIGWPQGMAPAGKRWSFMIDLAMEFAAAVSDIR
mmetsp:Transcript_44160/g.86638  ORF Transcript_44160/g.86638 Transcript_44160/m.86638 type:complete len:519 (-) Transcript_44160:235-1791(-)